MKKPLDLRFIGLAPSEAVESAVRTRVEQIEGICADITGLRVAIEQEHRHQHQGREFSVRLDLTLPGQELALTHFRHEDVYVALRDAFDAAKRRIEEAVRIRRGEVKQHAA
jgi:ribosome-associated translation inhibitor RaiA